MAHADLLVWKVIMLPRIVFVSLKYQRAVSNSRQFTSVCVSAVTLLTDQLESLDDDESLAG